MLDCRSSKATPLPIPPDVLLVVCNTGIKHQLAGGEDNVRRAHCKEGVHRFSSVIPGLRALRDVTPIQLDLFKELLPELIYRRCRHVVTENERVQRAAEALLSGDLPAFGIFMAESHRSLRDDYEISCAELDSMVEIAMIQPGVIGARMTGADLVDVLLISFMQKRPTPLSVLSQSSDRLGPIRSLMPSPGEL